MGLWQKDRMKLLRDGYDVLRRDYQRLVIKCATMQGGWGIYESGFKSKAHLDSRMSELLKFDNVIEDV